MYKVVYAESVLKDVRKLSAEVRERIKTKIEWLAENFDMIKPERLKGEL